MIIDLRSVALPADTSTTAVVTSDDVVRSTLTAGDEDWIAVDLAAGETYVFTAGTSASTYEIETQLYFDFVLYDGAGTVLGGSAAGRSTSISWKTADIRYTAEDAGRYYLSIKDNYTDYPPGNYSLSMTQPTLDHPPVSSLLWGDSPAWDNDPIRVHFYPDMTGLSIPYYSSSYREPDFEPVSTLGWNTDQRAVMLGILEQVSTFTNVTFTQIDNPVDADFKLAMLDGGSGSGGSPTMHGPTIDAYGDRYADSYPSPAYDLGYTMDGFLEVYDGTPFWSADRLAPGGWSLFSLLQAVGSGLGLAQPNATAYGSTNLEDDELIADARALGFNSPIYTVMTNQAHPRAVGATVTETSGNAMGFGALDIGALQSLYGRNMEHATGDDHYTVDGMNGYMAIWDAGGTDTLRAKTPEDAVLDLRAATLRYEEGGGGYVSHVDGTPGGLTIAKHTLIENARTGDGADVVEGNYVANFIRTGDGNDEVRARNGNDTVIADGGDDVVRGGAGDDRLYGNGGLDQVFGDGGNDRMRGNRGEDMLDGGTGDDIMLGGGSADILLGGDGDDWLHGGGREDTLTGGTGDDVLIGDWGADVFVFAPGDGRDVIRDFAQGEDVIDLSAHGFTDLTDVLSGAEDRDGFLKLVLAPGDVLYLMDLTSDDLAEGDLLL